VSPTDVDIARTVMTRVSLPADGQCMGWRVRSTLLPGCILALCARSATRSPCANFERLCDYRTPDCALSDVRAHSLAQTMDPSRRAPQRPLQGNAIERSRGATRHPLSLAVAGVARPVGLELHHSAFLPGPSRRHAHLAGVIPRRRTEHSSLFRGEMCPECVPDVRLGR